MSPGCETPAGTVRGCIRVRPGICYLITDRTDVLACHSPTARVFFPQEIYQMGTVWEDWLIFDSAGMQRIFRLWPHWREALEDEGRGTGTAADGRECRRVPVRPEGDFHRFLRKGG